MNYRIIHIIIIAVLQNLSTVIAQNLKCDDFKYGTFQLINTKAEREYKIIRKDKSQTEQTFDLISEKKIRSDRFFNITWRKNCEYILFINLDKSSHDDFDIYINSKGGLINTIIKIENKCAEIETRFEDQKSFSKICKVN